MPINQTGNVKSSDLMAVYWVGLSGATIIPAFDLQTHRSISIAGQFQFKTPAAFGSNINLGDRIEFGYRGHEAFYGWVYAIDKSNNYIYNVTVYDGGYGLAQTGSNATDIPFASATLGVSALLATFATQVSSLGASQTDSLGINITAGQIPAVFGWAFSQGQVLQKLEAIALGYGYVAHTDYFSNLTLSNYLIGTVSPFNLPQITLIENIDGVIVLSKSFDPSVKYGAWQVNGTQANGNLVYEPAGFGIPIRVLGGDWLLVGTVGVYAPILAQIADAYLGSFNEGVWTAQIWTKRWFDTSGVDIGGSISSYIGDGKYCFTVVPSSTIYPSIGSSVTATSGIIPASSLIVGTLATSPVGGGIVVLVILADIVSYKSVSSITDSHGNTYTKITNVQTPGSGGLYFDAEVWGAYGITGTSNIVTVYLSASTAISAQAFYVIGGTSTDSYGAWNTTLASTQAVSDVVVHNGAILFTAQFGQEYATPGYGTPVGFTPLALSPGAGGGTSPFVTYSVYKQDVLAGTNTATWTVAGDNVSVMWAITGAGTVTPAHMFISSLASGSVVATITVSGNVGSGVYVPNSVSPQYYVVSGNDIVGIGGFMANNASSVALISEAAPLVGRSIAYDGVDTLYTASGGTLYATNWYTSTSSAIATITGIQTVFTQYAFMKASPYYFPGFVYTGTSNGVYLRDPYGFPSNDLIVGTGSYSIYEIVLNNGTTPFVYACTGSSLVPYFLPGDVSTYGTLTVSVPGGVYFGCPGTNQATMFFAGTTEVVQVVSGTVSTIVAYGGGTIITDMTYDAAYNQVFVTAAVGTALNIYRYAFSGGWSAVGTIAVSSQISGTTAWTSIEVVTRQNLYTVLFQDEDFMQYAVVTDVQISQTGVTVTLVSNGYNFSRVWNPNFVGPPDTTQLSLWNVTSTAGT